MTETNDEIDDLIQISSLRGIKDIPDNIKYVGVIIGYGCECNTSIYALRSQTYDEACDELFTEYDESGKLLLVIETSTIHTLDTNVLLKKWKAFQLLKKIEAEQEKECAEYERLHIKYGKH